MEESMMKFQIFQSEEVETEMFAVFVGEKGKASLRQIETPVPAAGEALIRIIRSGICNTDLEILDGYMQFDGIVGHEFVGKVIQVNYTEDSLLGKRVVGDINLPCRQSSSCHICRTGGDMARNHCPNRTVLGILNKSGCHAQYITLPIQNLHVISDSIPDEVATFTEPLAAALRIVEQNLLRKNDHIAIIGDGKLGLLIAEVLGRQEMLEQKPVLYGKHQEKMSLVSDVVSTHHVEEALSGKNAAFDVVVDVTGNPEGLNLAQNLCKPLGTIVLKSTCAAAAGFNTAIFVIDELRVIGSRCGPFDEAIKFLERYPDLNLNKYVTATFPLENAEEAFHVAKSKGTLKIQLECI
mmetsp:Transcript_28511/g.37296  ORF Transcript_28511/g.37296 Transcript_28511/m.37296 type:complete len:352 (+) Transcript_28511:71-1126(+)